MRLNQILTESEQRELEMLQEGPLGSLVKAAGRGVGNVIGGVAKAAGAVKGAVKGAVDRAKSSFAAGEKGAHDTLMGKKTAGAPAAAGGSAAGTGGSAAGGSGSGGAAAGGSGGAGGGAGGSASGGAGGSASATGGTTNVNITNQPAAQEKPAAGAAQAGDEKSAAGTAQAGAQDAAAQDGTAKPADAPKASANVELVKKQLGMIDDAAKKEIVALLQNDPDIKAAGAEQPAGGRAQGGGKVAGQLSNTPGAVRKREQRAQAKAAGGEKDAMGGGAFGNMAAQLAGPQGSSTGGTTTTTPTGRTHRASANNPNQPAAQATTQPAATTPKARKKPVNISGKTTTPAAKTAVNAGLEKKAKPIVEGFSIFRRD